MTATTMNTTPLAVAALPQDVGQMLADAGAQVANCLQCRKCSNGCPVADRADIQPHQMARMIQLGKVDELLTSRAIWECLSCQTCATRCPQKVDVAARQDALRRMSRAQGKVVAGTTVPVFNDIFLRTVQRQGRMYEMGLMAEFKLRTRRFMDDVAKFPMMLLKGKLALLPTFVRGAAERRRLFKISREAGGKVR
ncbi:MAG: 4Fe-4S dicluster domain-containing protein [Kiritimatiellaeota bacterium]|nr:4Fe-4S dicluster domain-containing protein [Kiritimatiellota bacterium]